MSKAEEFQKMYIKAIKVSDASLESTISYLSFLIEKMIKAIKELERD